MKSTNTIISVFMCCGMREAGYIEKVIAESPESDSAILNVLQENLNRLLRFAFSVFNQIDYDTKPRLVYLISA